MRADDVFAILEQAAVTGSRCPQNRPHGPLSSTLVVALARAGRIRIEVYLHNYRVVTILTGPHAGKHTLPPPQPKTGPRIKPYKVTDAASTRVNGVPQEPYATRTRRIGPSTPRDYSVAHGLRDLKERR